MVEARLAWVTAGLIAPGVQWRSGRVNGAAPRAWQLPAGGWGWTVVELAVLTGSPRDAWPAAPARFAAGRWGGLAAVAVVVAGATARSELPPGAAPSGLELGVPPPPARP